jgi:ABC-2 type transport system ATP-binding protein
LETQEGKLVISLQSPEEQNPILVRAIVEAGGEVQSVGEIRHSLEEVYLTLVRGKAES